MADEPKRFDPLVQVPTLDSLAMDIKDLQDQVMYLMQRRITQADVLPDSIKQRAVGEGVRFIRSGLEANLPTPPEKTAMGLPFYWAYDTHTLWIWDGTIWRFVILT